VDAGKLTGFVQTNLRPEKYWVNLDNAVNTRKIEDAMEWFMENVRQGINQSTPWAKPSTWANADFTPECRDAIKSCRRLRRVWITTHNEADWHEYVYTMARNQKGKIIARTLRRGHRRRVQEATEQGPRGLWRLAKWTRTSEQAADKGIISALTDKRGRTANTMEEKAAMLREKFS
jgi:hypothetical protein